MSVGGSTDRLELASYTRREDGGTKASYLDPNDRTKSMIEIWIPFSGDGDDEQDKMSYFKRTSTLPSKINLIRNGDEVTRERHQSEPQVGSMSIFNDSAIEEDAGRTSSAAEADLPHGGESYYGNAGTLRSQSSWKSGVTTPHSLSSTLLHQASVTNPYDRFMIDAEKEKKKRRCLPWLLCCIIFFILAAVAITLAVLLTTVLKPGSKDAIGANPTSAGIAKNPPVNGNWSAWSEWSECSQPCSGGKAERFRTCDNPSPSNKGANCTGSNQNTKTCNTVPCPPDAVNGSWGQWGNWSTCSATCGEGHQIRKRLCDSPSRNEKGRNCEGNNEEFRPCNLQTCNVPRFTVTGVVRDATDRKVIANADVSLAGKTTKTDEKGVYSLDNIAAAMYTLVASAPGYALNTKRITVQENITEGATTILLSPVLPEGFFRVVLSWGRVPEDLDLYVLTPENCQVFYNSHSCKGSNGSETSLDVDVFAGFGPETITLKNPRIGEAYVVYASIFRRSLSHQGSFVDSNAQVQLFDDTGLIQTVNVPRAGYDKLDDVWYVLNITPRENGPLFEVVNNVRKTRPTEKGSPPSSVDKSK